ncbi:MAG: universal stress protein [Deltaproteobacteria bacterium]|nr:universal stress protein [Deltaproteobacteria bacterium]
MVVGVDGSSYADKALEFAAQEAEFRGANLRVVSAWGLPIGMHAGATPAVNPSLITAFEELACQNVDRAISKARHLHPSLKVEGRVVMDQPVKAILDQSRDAILVVVGNRGLGGFASLLMGSVSQQTVHHAHCPVAVVRS